MPDPLKAAHDALRDYALSFPGAVEDHPWGEMVFKVNKKIFLFLGGGDDGLGLGVKLPESNEFALSMDFTKPSGYGLGQHGWVSVKIPKGKKPPVDLIRAWVEESYRAIAPKKLIAQLDAASAGAPAAPEKKRVRRPATPPRRPSAT